MIFGSNNKDKLEEVRSIFKGVDITALSDLNLEVDVEEDQKTFFENALKKAKEIYEVCKEPVIADDSGLCLESLGGWPGVMTNRFLDANWDYKNDYIIRKVSDYEDKSCEVVCNIVYYDGGESIVGKGSVTGKIVSPRGDNGFGFDPIVELENGKTLAELSRQEKNKCSARYLAIQDLYRKLVIYGKIKK